MGLERERALLRDALHTARKKSGSLIFVHGPAGAGKTRLLQTVFGKQFGV